MMKLSVRVVYGVTMVVALLCAGPVRGQPQGAAGEGAAPATVDEALMNMLESTLVDAAYDRVDFDRVIDDLRERFNLNIHVSWTALEKVGVRRDQRIEIRLKQVPLATMLKIILREVSDPTDPLTYLVEDGVLVISLGGALREQTVLRSYDVTDLIESGYAIRRFANTPVLGLELTGREFVGGEQRKQAGSGGSGGGGGERGSIFGDPGEGPDRLSVLERIQQIIDMITAHIDPDSWADLGGDIGTVYGFESTLFIQHTLGVHQQIAKLLSMLRATRPEPLDADVAVIRLRADRAVELRQQIGDRFPRLTAEEAAQLALSSKSEGVLFRGTVSGFNGSRLWFSALTQRDVLSGMTATVGQSVNAFAPKTATSTSGLELIVLPLLSPISDEVTVDVQMAWVPNAEISEREVTLGAGSAASTIDQTARSMRTVSAATTVKLGEAIAFSIPAQLNDASIDAEWEDWLIVRVRRPGT